jgi:hypothetical protein
MSFVKELEERMAMERRKLLEIVADYLHSVEVDAHLDEEEAADVYGNIIKQPVIKVTGRNLDSIRIISADYFGCALPDDIARFQYEIPLEKKADTEIIRQMPARIEYERDKKTLGLFGGTITGIHWTGDKLADLLNRDSELSGILFHCTGSPGNPEFEVKMKSLNAVEIRGPRFADLQRISMMFTRGIKEGFEECVFGFKTADKIAGHIRTLLNNG